MHDRLKDKEVKVGLRKVQLRMLYHDLPELGSFTRLIDSLEGILNTNNIAILCDDISSFGDDSDDLDGATKFGMSALAASVSNCRVFKLDKKALSISKLLNVDSTARYLVCRAGLGIYIAGLAGVTLEDMNQSSFLQLPPLSQSGAFTFLWSKQYDIKEVHAIALENDKNMVMSIFMMGLGENIALQHNRRIVNGDIHTGNFGFNKDNKVLCVDVGSVRLLLRELRPEERSRDIISLLPELTPFDWACFKLGYLAGAGDEGFCAINYIETGNDITWSIYYNRGDYNKASQCIQAEIKKHEADGDSGLESDYLNLGLCYSRLSKFSAALECFRHAQELTVEFDCSFEAALLNNIAMTYYRMGEFTTAILKFESLRSNTAIQANKTLLFSLLYHLADSYHKIGNKSSALEINETLLRLIRKVHGSVESAEEQRQRIVDGG